MSKISIKIDISNINILNIGYEQDFKFHTFFFISQLRKGIFFKKKKKKNKEKQVMSYKSRLMMI